MNRSVSGYFGCAHVLYKLQYYFLLFKLAQDGTGTNSHTNHYSYEYMHVQEIHFLPSRSTLYI